MKRPGLVPLILAPALFVCSLFILPAIASADMDDIPDTVRPKLKALFAEAGCVYPPAGLTMIALKDERVLELWADGVAGDSRLVAEYPILAASGTAGPKLMRGDRQVPEGVYRVLYLNPYSKYHLSMKINYPNEFDCEMGRCDGRGDLGGDIFIHGKAKSIGCIAVGDAAIEEIFQLVHDMDGAPVKVVIAPYDFRGRPATTASASCPAWLPGLYDIIATEMSAYRKDGSYRQALVTTSASK